MKHSSEYCECITHIFAHLIKKKSVIQFIVGFLFNFLLSGLQSSISILQRRHLHSQTQIAFSSFPKLQLHISMQGTRIPAHFCKIVFFFLLNVSHPLSCKHEVVKFYNLKKWFM